jgi:hypothetical protein
MDGGARSDPPVCRDPRLDMTDSMDQNSSAYTSEAVCTRDEPEAPPLRAAGASA